MKQTNPPTESKLTMPVSQAGKIVKSFATVINNASTSINTATKMLPLPDICGGTGAVTAALGPAVQRRQWVELAMDGPVGAHGGVLALREPDAQDLLQLRRALVALGQAHALGLEKAAQLRLVARRLERRQGQAGGHGGASWLGWAECPA